MGPKVKPKRINLALQGGGAHGAFTWGVLDAILDCPEVEIAAISGTSAGALNGAAVKSGLSRGSRDLARERLAWVWEKVGAITDDRFAPWLEAVAPEAISFAIESSLPFAVGDTLGRMVSPYASGPFYQNPLEPIVSELHYEHICCDTGPAFYICATNVRSGKIRIFTGNDISPQSIMASGLFAHPVPRGSKSEDPDTGTVEAYWDGGYTGNPCALSFISQRLTARCCHREYQPPLPRRGAHQRPSDPEPDQ